MGHLALINFDASWSLWSRTNLILIQIIPKGQKLDIHPSRPLGWHCKHRSCKLYNIMLRSDYSTCSRIFLIWFCIIYNTLLHKHSFENLPFSRFLPILPPTHSFVFLKTLVQDQFSSYILLKEALGKGLALQRTGVALQPAHLGMWPERNSIWRLQVVLSKLWITIGPSHQSVA